MSEKPEDKQGRHSTENVPAAGGDSPQAAHVQNRPTPAVAGAQPKNYSELMRQNSSSQKNHSDRKPSSSNSNRKRKRR